MPNWQSHIYSKKQFHLSFPVKHTKGIQFLGDEDLPENFRYENGSPLHVSALKSNACHKFQSFIPGHSNGQKAIFRNSLVAL